MSNWLVNTIFLVLPASSILFGIVSFIVFIVKGLKKPGFSKLIKYYCLILICLIVMTASWILNMGWYRVFLTWIAFPVFHSALFAVINFKAVSRLPLSKTLKVYMLLSCITYMATYMLFPDGGDVGTTYMFFGLIHSDAIYEIAMTSAIVCFIANVVFSFLTLIKFSKVSEIAEGDE